MSDDSVRSCHSRIFDGLVAKMEHRSRFSWVEDERLAVAEAANAWALAHPGSHTVSVDDVELIEHLAMGHVDYASKLALYVAEMVVGQRARAPRPSTEHLISTVTRKKATSTNLPRPSTEAAALDANIMAAGFHGYEGCPLLAPTSEGSCPTPFICSERGDCGATPSTPTHSTEARQ